MNDQAEYDTWKGMFSVEDGGEGVAVEEEEEGMLLRFVRTIQERKVAVLEELGGEFGLKVHDVISRVHALEQMGYVSGVVDDRGKFIYISRSEMEAVAKYINRKGRVRISALAQESNKLIDLKPRAESAAAEAEDDEAS